MDKTRIDMEYEYDNIDPIEEARRKAEAAAEDAKDVTKYLLDYSTPIPRPTPVIVDPTNPNRIIVSEQNIFTIIGQEKSYKSFCCSLLTIDYFTQHPDKECLLIDTEQAMWNVQNVAKRVCNGMGWGYAETYQSGKLRIAHLRPYSKKERLEAVEALIEKFHPYLVIVDGIRDLVESVNDDVICSAVVDKFMKWSEVYNCAIGTVLHTNKDGETAKGHLGAELLNKSEIILLCKAKENARGADVKCWNSRNERIESFEIEIDGEYVPHRVEKTKEEEDTIKFANEKETRACKNLQRVAGQSSAIWVAQIQSSIQCARATALKYFNDFVELGILVQDGKDSTFFSHYLINGLVPKRQEPDTQQTLIADNSLDDSGADPF